MLQFVGLLLRSFTMSISAYAEYNKTFKELASLTDRELHDIGLSRGMIHSCAVDASNKFRA